MLGVHRAGLGSTGGHRPQATVNQPAVRADETRRLAIPYVDVAGLNTWHEVSGEGDPVVLLHAGFVGASSWAGQAESPGLVNELLLTFLRGGFPAGG